MEPIEAHTDTKNVLGWSILMNDILRITPPQNCPPVDISRADNFDIHQHDSFPRPHPCRLHSFTWEVSDMVPLPSPRI